MSGEVIRTPDLVLSDTENITNAKLNRVGGGTYKIKAGSITSTELSADIGGGYATVSALRNNSDTFTDGDAVECRGYYTDGAGDFGPNVYYDQSDTTTADDGFTCFVDTSNRRFKRESFDEPVNVKWAGAKGDDSNDDATPIQTILDWMISSGRRGKVVFPPGTYKLGSTLSIEGVSIGIEGEGSELATTLKAYHLNGPVVRLKGRHQYVRNFDITADSSTRPKGSANTTDHGIMVEEDDEASQYPKHAHLENLYIEDQPASAIVMVGGCWFSKIESVNIRDCGGHGVVYTDGTYPYTTTVIATDGAITSGTNTLACASGTPFADPATGVTMVGDKITVAGAGVAGADLITTITTVTDDNNVVLTDNASTTVSGANVSRDVPHRNWRNVPNGIADLNLIEVFDCGGHAFFLGNPGNMRTEDRCIRIQGRNLDAGRNATDTGVREASAAVYGFFDDTIITHSAFDGRNGTAPYQNSVRAIEVHGKNIKIANNRFLNPYPQAVKIGGTVDSFTTENVVIEDNYIVKSNDVTWQEASGKNDRGCIIESGADVEGMVIRRWAGDNLLEAPGPYGTTDSNQWDSRETIVQWLLTSQVFQSNTTQRTLLNPIASGSVGTDPGMWYELLENERVRFRAIIFHTGSISADLDVSITVPSGAEVRYGTPSGMIVDASDAVVQSDAATSSGTEFTFGAHGTNQRMAVLEGYVLTQGTSGYLEVKAAQNASVASNTTLYRGSHLIIYK